MKRSLAALTLIATIGLPAAGQTRQSGDGFNWTGRVPAGRWIHVKNLNGPITVGASTSDNVEVVATKHWRRGDPSVVHFFNEKNGDDVTICAVWGDATRCNDDHNNNSGGRRNRNNDVSVEFRVLVPRGVKVEMETVNGDVTVDGATSEVRAESVNGEVSVGTSGGRVNAESVNGSVRAQLGKLDSDGDMKFETVNGNVIVEFTGEFGGDVDLETVNGSLNTNFEMTVSGRLDPKHIRAHIGRAGGPHIKLETVNGNVELRKR
ncbi:MAG TPA: hypothetical protein VN706_24950 [Gemmatimonadaceae bacterium]|nr:hypothetical protein [Gemmatimonadaceae bacterium]